MDEENKFGFAEEEEEGCLPAKTRPSDLPVPIIFCPKPPPQPSPTQTLCICI